MEYSYAFLILLLPFLSFLLIGLAGMKMKKPVAGLIGTIMLGSVFAMSLYTDRKSTRLNSSHANISYAVFCLKKKHLPPSTFTTSKYSPTVSLIRSYTL